jgi:16S rRNA (cytidine1402-2'-O)-methyltransferase
VRGTAADLAERFADGARGEIVLVVEGAPPVAADAGAAIARVLDLAAQGTRLKDAAALVAGETGLSKRDLYEGALTAR